jgi:hypothetical protein
MRKIAVDQPRAQRVGCFTASAAAKGPRAL